MMAPNVKSKLLVLAMVAVFVSVIPASNADQSKAIALDTQADGVLAWKARDIGGQLSQFCFMQEGTIPKEERLVYHDYCAQVEVLTWPCIGSCMRCTCEKDYAEESGLPMCPVAVNNQTRIPGKIKPASGGTCNLPIGEEGITIVMADDWRRYEDCLTIKGDIFVHATNIGSFVSFPNLQSLRGSLIVASNSLMQMLSFPSLTSISGSIDISDNDQLVHMEFPALENVGGNFTLSNLEELSTINFGRLSTVGGDFDINNLMYWKNDDGIKAVKKIGGEIRIFDNPRACDLKHFTPENAQHITKGEIHITQNCEAGGSMGIEAFNKWEDYVNLQEEMYDFQPDCAPTAIDADPSVPYRGVVMYLHSFTACPSQFYQMGRIMAARGFQVLIPTLPGHGQAHGTVCGIFGFCKRKDLLNGIPSTAGECEGEYDRFMHEMNDIMIAARGEKAITGLALGGALAAQMSQMKDEEDNFIYDRALLQTPELALPRVSVFGIGLLNMFPFLRGIRLGWGETCEKQTKDCGRKGSCTFTVGQLACSVIMSNTINERLETAVVPTQAIMSFGDDVVSAPATKHLFDKMTAESIYKNRMMYCFMDESVPHLFNSEEECVPGLPFIWLNYKEKEGSIWNQMANFLDRGEFFPLLQSSFFKGAETESGHLNFGVLKLLNGILKDFKDIFVTLKEDVKLLHGTQPYPRCWESWKDNAYGNNIESYYYDN
eukprot:Nk52_evm7s259 gene=Nk52_evmTU7s259